MAHLIDKDALVAEIEKRYETNLIGAHSAFRNGKIEALREVKDFIDTLEIKEVDIENKKMEWIEQLCKYFKANYLYVSGHESFISDFRRYAKDLK